jgi:hypothetical protein
MARTILLFEVCLAVAGATIAGCGGSTARDVANQGGAGGAGGAGGTGGADAAPDPGQDGTSDAGPIGERAVSEFEAALRAFCKCDDDPELDCFDWSTRFQGEKRDCYVAFLDRHAAEGLAACVLDSVKSIRDCLQVCTARCDSAALLHDSPMRSILFDKCHAPPAYVEETDDCSGP